MGFSYISDHGRKMLPKYQYKGRDRSLFYKYISSPGCDWIVELLPRWLAPNLITFLGLIVICIAHAVVFMYAPDLEGDIPAWVCVMQAVSGLVYQTLDNLDGKQARRTGSSSPLGLLFDHGIDAIILTMGGLSICSIFQCGQTWLTLGFWVSGALGFYMASWEEYYTGAFDLPIFNGPNEGILIITALNLMTAYFGNHIWKQDSIIKGCQNNSLLIIVLLVCSFLTSLENIYAVYKSEKRIKEMKVSMFTALGKALPFVALNGLAFLWLYISPKKIMELHPRLVVWTLGLAFAKLVMLLIVAHMCDEEYHPWRRSIMPIFFMAAHVSYSIFQGAYPGFDEKLVIEELFVVSVLAYSHMVWSLITDCCEILDIYCFTIKVKAKAKTKTKKK